MVRFIFDLDGTITSKGIIPTIAEHFSKKQTIDRLTDAAISGNVPFVESFIKSVYYLSECPVEIISSLIGNITVHQEILSFIYNHRDQCVLTTACLDCWIDKLCEKIGCEVYSSKAEVESDKVTKVISILRKENVVKQYQLMGDVVVFIGDGIDDLEAMRQANISITLGLTRRPANAVLGITDYVIFDGGALCRQLNQLL